MASKKKTNPERINYGCLDLIRLTKNQQRFVDTILKNEINFCIGPAGTAKTFVACYTALKLLSKGKIKKIILTKPAIESGEKLGFLPGDIEDKVSPYMESFMLSMKKIAGDEIVDLLMEHEVIEIRPLAYMRGATFDNSFMVLDEAQNSDFRQLMLYITRKGHDTKVLIQGDVSQYDISKDKVALPKFKDMLSGIKGVAFFEFMREDIVRSKILIEVTDRYEKWKEDNTSD